MPNKDVNVSRAQASDPLESLKARVQAEFAAAVEKKMALQLGVTPWQPYYMWNVWAWGPFSTAGTSPAGRIIKVNTPATIVTVVYMNSQMCANVEGFEADILLNYWTANTQKMQPVLALHRQVCIEPAQFTIPGFGCYSFDYFTFTPTEEACLLETNICARLCNCEGTTVPGYAAFVRWVYNFDPEVLFPATPGYEFDYPIRYMVYDPDAKCECPPTI